MKGLDEVVGVDLYRVVGQTEKDVIVQQLRRTRWDDNCEGEMQLTDYGDVM